MVNLLGRLKLDPEFRKLSTSAQMVVAQRMASDNFAQDPAFQALSPAARQTVLNRISLDAPTFEDPETEQKVLNTGQAYYRGDPVSGKKLREFWDATVMNSGILGFVDQYIVNSGSPTRGQDRQRALDYYRSMDKLTGRSDMAGAIGAIAGVLVDVAGVSIATSPITGAAKGAVAVAARGGTAAVAKAAALNTTAAVTRRGLEFFGPVAAEALVEAVPYLLVEEQRRAQQGQESVIAGGAVEILKSVGMNAALDFAAGSIMLGALTGSAKLGRAIFKKGGNYREVVDQLEHLDTIKKQIAVGATTPEIMASANDIDRALARSNLAIDDFQRKGLTDPDNYAFNRDAILAHDMKKILSYSEEATGPTPYTLYEFADDGRPRKRPFQSLRDAEDTLTYEYYKGQEKLAEKVMKDKKVTFDEALLDPSITNPLHVWAIQRGKLLRDQMARFDPKLITDPDPVLKAGLKDTPKWWKEARNRPIITRSEADALLQNPAGIAIQTQVELKGTILEAANEAGNRKSIDLLRGQAPLAVKTHDQPNALFIGTRQAPQEAYDSATQTAQRILSSGHYQSLEEARAALLMNKGFDYAILPDQSVEFFTTRNMKLIGSTEDVISPIVKGTNAGSASTSAIISESRRVFLKAQAVQKNPDLILGSGIKAFRSGDPEQIRTFGTMYSKSAGVPIDNMKVQFVRRASDAGVRLVDGTPTILIPKSVTSFSDEKKLISRIFDDLNKYIDEVPGTGKKAISPSDFYINKLNTAPARFGFPVGIDPSTWAGAAIVRMGGTLSKTAEGFEVLLPSGRVFLESAEALTDWVAKHTLDEATVVNSLLAEGIRVVKNPKTGEFVARSLDTGAELAKAPDLHKLVDAVGFTPQSIDIAYGARNIELKPEGLEFDLGGSLYLKDQKTALKTIGKFTDQKVLNQKKFIKQSAKGDLSVLPGGSYRVNNRILGFQKEFDNLADARRFFETDLAKVSDLEEVANRKMLDFWIQDGNYVTKDLNGNIFRTADYDDLAKHFRDYPDISESVPELIPLDPETAAALPDIARAFKAHSWNMKSNPLYRAPPELPEFSHVSDPYRINTFEAMQVATADAFGFIDEISAKYGDKQLSKFRQDLIGKTRTLRMDVNNTGVYLKSAFNDSAGKQLPVASRQKIFYQLSAERGSEADSALRDMYKARHGKVLEDLTPDEQAAADKLRDLYDVLGTKFNIDYRKLIHEYMPRIREKMPMDIQSLMDNPEMLKYLSIHVPEWSGNNMPKEIKFWAEHARASDLPQYFLKDDALEVALMYSAQGHKKYHLNPVFKEVNRYVVESGGATNGTIDPAVVGRLQVLQQDIMGLNQTNGEKVVADFGEKFARALKRGPLGSLFKSSEDEMADVGRNTLNNLLGLTYFSSMGFKPWLAIRNSFQTDTMLAMRVGVDWNMKAKKEVLGNLDDWVRKGFERGILNEKAPIVNLVFSQGKTGKLAEKSFQMFKNSDDYTRLVAYVAGDMRAGNAISMLRMNPTMSRGAFLMESGLDRFNPELGDRAWDLAQKGMKQVEVESAGGALDINTGAPISVGPTASNQFFDGIKDMYGNTLQRATMFDYSGAGTPLLYRGVVGRMFGQFGTYSSSFRANIAEAMRYGTPAQKAASIATYLGMTGAYWAAFEAMRIRTQDFIPFAPGIFTGGPTFDLSLNLLRSMDTGFEGQQARASVKRDITTMVPGSSQWRYMKRGLEYAESGDYEKVLMAAMMIPMYSE